MILLPNLSFSVNIYGRFTRHYSQLRCVCISYSQRWIYWETMSCFFYASCWFMVGFFWGIVEQMKLNNIFVVFLTWGWDYVLCEPCYVLGLRCVCFTYVLNTKYICRWLDIQAVFQEDIFICIYIYTNLLLIHLYLFCCSIWFCWTWECLLRKTMDVLRPPCHFKRR